MQAIRHGALLLAALALLAGASLAQAAETTRPEYVAAVEPICKLNTQANEKIFKGVRQEVKAGRLAPAGAAFAKATAALKQTYLQLAAVPQPQADAPRLAKWLADVKAETALFAATAQKLKTADKAGAEAMVVRLEHEASLANDQVLAFEFQYCRFEPSRFT